MAATPLVLRELGSGTREALAAVLRDRGVDGPIAALELGSTASVKAALRNGSDPAVLSHLTVRNEVTSGELVEVRVADVVIERELRAVWRIGTPLAPAADRLLAQLASPAPAHRA